MIDLSVINYRYDIPKIIPKDSIALELGVAEGGFSEAILKDSNVSYLYSVDRYSNERGHDDNQYLRAIKRLDGYKNRNTLIRSEFHKCLNLFPDNYFDFIYIDGYAHTGQENGKTIEDWWPKLKNNGLFCGDDYTDKYPLVKQHVKTFAKNKKLEIYVIQCKPEPDWASQEPSWLILKN